MTEAYAFENTWWTRPLRPFDAAAVLARSARSIRAHDPLAKRTARIFDEFWIRGFTVLTERPHKLGNYRIHVGDIEHRIFVKPEPTP